MTPLSGTFQPCGGVVVVVEERVAEKQAHRDVLQKRKHGRKKRWESQRGKARIRRHREKIGELESEEVKDGREKKRKKKQRKRKWMNEEWDVHRGFLSCALGLYVCVWLQISWYCSKIEWFGIKPINISLSFDGGPGGVWKIKMFRQWCHELHLGQ